MSVPHTLSSIENIPEFEQADNLYRKGDLKQALALYRQVNLLRPDLSAPWSRMGLIHLQMAQWETAVACYRQAILRDEHRPDYWYNLAQGLEESGKPHEAMPAYTKAVQLNSQYSEAVFNLGRLHLVQGDWTEASNLFQRCVEIAPDNAAAYNNLGKALYGLNRIDKAIACYARAIEIDANLGEAWFNLAEIKSSGKNPDQAIPFYRKAINALSDPGAAYNNLGNLFKKLKDYKQACGCYAKVVELNPDLAEAHYNLGSVFRLMEIYEPALGHLAQAVRLKPDFAEAWNNLALTCKNIGELDRALVCFNKAVACQPKLAVARWNRAFVYFLKEDYTNGWKDFEWRFQVPHWKSIYPLRPESPRWDGRSYADKTILVHDEQGLGDTLQFVRYLPLVKARCNRAILETRPELIPLLKSVSGIDQIVIRPKKETEQEPCDFHVPLMSLPGIFHTTPDTIPGPVPYLHADPVKSRNWSSRLPNASKRIGIVWAGRPQHANDRNRSCPLGEMLPLTTVPGTRFFSLQKGTAAGQLNVLPVQVPIDDLGSQLEDFSDTAAVVANLDLVITVDTAMAHLAGAMGKRVWVMIPFIADWRWGAHRQDSPWYPGIRLFRQKKPGDWTAVIRSMGNALKQLVQCGSDTTASRQKDIANL